MRRSLGSRQLNAFSRLASIGPEGATFDELIGVRPSGISRSIRDAFTAAVGRHNAAVRNGTHVAGCDPRCPIPNDLIDEERLGPRGGYRIRLHKWVELALRGTERSFAEFGSVDTLSDTERLWQAAHTPDYPILEGLPLVQQQPWCHLVANSWLTTRVPDLVGCLPQIAKITSVEAVISAVLETDAVMSAMPEEVVAFFESHRQSVIVEAVRLAVAEQHGEVTVVGTASRLATLLSPVPREIMAGYEDYRGLYGRFSIRDLVCGAEVLLGFHDEQLGALCKFSPDVSLIVASYANTPGTVLVDLAQSNQVATRVAVAQHPHTPLHVLEDLALDPEPEVRSAVIARKEVPQRTHIIAALSD